jgi:hypothetical protein
MMSDEEIDRTTTMMQDQLRHMDALYEIVNSSDEAEVVRLAISALTGTPSGLAYLQAHPIIL